MTQVIRLRTPSSRGVLWQKERLLNIGIERAPAHCEKIVWADLDIDFLSDSWVRDLSRTLDTHVVAQPFAWAYRMLSFEGQDPANAGLDRETVLSQIPTGAFDGQMLHSAGFGLSVLRSMNRSKDGIDARLRGHSGYACAARRDFLRKVGGLYDKMITGGGDDVMAKAWQNMGVVGQGRDHFPPTLQHDAQGWIDYVGSQTLGDVGFLKGVILHHYRGSQSNRHYSMRMRILRDHNFNPDTDIEQTPDGVWVWRNDPGAFACRVVRGLLARALS